MEHSPPQGYLPCRLPPLERLLLDTDVLEESLSVAHAVCLHRSVAFPDCQLRDSTFDAETFPTSVGG